MVIYFRQEVVYGLYQDNNAIHAHTYNTINFFYLMILFFSSFPRQIAHLCLQLLNFISFGLSTSLSIGVFFLQFLDYWYNTLHSTNSPIALTMQPIPKKPKPVSSSLLFNIFFTDYFPVYL